MVGGESQPSFSPLSLALAHPHTHTLALAHNLTRHPSFVTRHPSPVTRHPSPVVTRHPSPATLTLSGAHLDSEDRLSRRVRHTPNVPHLEPLAAAGKKGVPERVLVENEACSPVRVGQA